MSIFFWTLLAALVVLYFYVSRISKEREQYFRTVMAELVTRDMPSDKLFSKLTPTEAGRILLACFRKQMPPEQAADVLLEKYDSKPEP